MQTYVTNSVKKTIGCIVVIHNHFAIGTKEL